jgi:hypothetical protein
MLDRAEPTSAGALPSAPPISRHAQAGGQICSSQAWIINAVIGLLIAVYIGAMSWWLYGAGLKIRDDAWTTTRTVRFEGDIRNAIRWGSLVMQTAEEMANSDAEHKRDPSTANINVVSSPRPDNPHERGPTFWELYHGVDQVYQDMVAGQSDEGDFGLDYPPLRLMSVSLWTRHVMKNIPGFQGWPGDWRLAYSPTGDPAELVSEDIAYPMLMANTYSIAASAVIVFFLVWIWTNRGGRPALAAPRSGWTAWFAPKRRLVPWKPVSLWRTNGLLLFPLATWAFFYAVVIAENPVPAPPPSIAYDGRPILNKMPDGRASAVIVATIDGQGSDAQYHVDWGTSIFYNHRTSDESAGSDEISATLANLPPNTTIHYRITAGNDRGITRTDDATFNTADTVAPLPPMDSFGAVWLSWPQWVGIGLLFIAMAAGLSALPPQHRGWACGLVAALMMWLDPSVVVDGHIWPQWDPWVLPPFLLAVLLATLDWWFVAGLVLGVGVMFKGQTMIAGSVLAIWPLLSLRWGALGRLAVGFVAAAGLVLSPWLLMDNAPADWSVGPLRWIGGVMAAAAIAAALSFYRRPLWTRAVDVWHELKNPPTELSADDQALATQGETYTAEGAALAVEPDLSRPQTSIFDLTWFCVALLAGIVIMTILVLRRWPTDIDVPARVWGLGLLLAVLLPPWFLPRRAMGVWFIGILGASIWMGAFLYHGDWTWKSVGFEYGTRKFTKMALGIGSNANIPQIMETRWGMDVNDPTLPVRLPDVADSLHLSSTGWARNAGLDGTPMTLDFITSMKSLFGISIFLAGLGAAIQSKRNDPRFLASLAAVWVIMANIMCQMAARYEMWGAAVSCVLIAISPGLALFHIVLTLLAAATIWHQLTQLGDVSRSPLIHDMFQRFGPDDGWIVLTIGLVILYTAVVPGKRPSPEELLSP